jgi:RNA-splicing ligase RtcB
MSVHILGDHDEKTIRQLENCVAVEDGAQGVLCADGHLGYSMPIGGVVAYREHVSPSAVGFDVACGNKAARTDLTYDEIADDLPRVMDEVFKRISFGVGRNDGKAGDHPVIEEIRHAAFEPQRELAKTAALQLGTVGAGNHYVDLFRDEDDRVWVGVHFGSRGFGHKTASGFLALAQGRAFGERATEGEMMTPPVVFPAGGELGRSYVEAMNLAGHYAYAGRDVVVAEVLDILGATADLEVHNNHNFCVPGDAILQTPLGPRRMDAIQVGDEVYAFDPHDGLRKTRVADHWHAGHKPVLEIRTASRSLRCSPDHPVLTISVIQRPHPTRPWHKLAVGTLQWRRAEDLRKGDIVLCAALYGDESTGVGVDRARLAGAFLGDGWRRETGMHIRGWTCGLAIGGPAEPHVADYHALLQRTLPAANWKSNARGTFGLTCSSRAVSETLVSLGVAGRSAARTVPSWAFALPTTEKRALLADYFDADGSVAGPATSNWGRGSIASASESLVIGLRDLAVGIGLRTTPTRREQRVTNYGACEVHICVIGADSMYTLPLWHREKASNRRLTIHQRPAGLQGAAIGYLTLPDDVMAQRVRSVVQIRESDDVFDLTVEHPSHTFVCDGIVTHNCWREEHEGETAWVVRKGATPAFPGQLGFAGATMAEPAVILEGVDSPASKAALYSTIHGAGRAMSRTQAAGRMGTRMECGVRDCANWVSRGAYQAGARCPDHPKARMFKRRGRIKPGRIDFADVQRELAAKGIELRGGAADEAPAAYKRLDEVLAYHEGTVRVLHRLHPIGVAMAPAETYDPFKD